MKIKINLTDFEHNVEFLIYRRSSDPMPGDSMFVARPVLLDFQSYVQGMRIEPTFVVPGGRELLQSLRDALDELGIPSNRHAKVEGLLEAQKVHLDDMRNLVFKKKP